MDVEGTGADGTGPRDTITAGLVGGGLRDSDMFIVSSMLVRSGAESESSSTWPCFCLFLFFSISLLRRAVGMVQAAKVHRAQKNTRISPPKTAAKTIFSVEVRPVW